MEGQTRDEKLAKRTARRAELRAHAERIAALVVKIRKVDGNGSD